MKPGTRIIVSWTTEAFNRGSEWIAFEVIDEAPDGYFVKGVNDPEGNKHDGSKCFINLDDTLNIHEWKREGDV